MNREQTDKIKELIDKREKKLEEVYQWFKQRCTNPKRDWYSNYGWRWIKCEWDTFKDFKKDMLESYIEHRKNNKTTLIDRIDNNKNYCKENCRWLTRVESNDNKRNTIKIEMNWETHTLREWCNKFQLPYRIIRARLKKYDFIWEEIFNKNIENVSKIKSLQTATSEPTVCKHDWTYFNNWKACAKCFKIYVPEVKWASEPKKIEELNYVLEWERPLNTPLTDANMSRIESKLNEVIQRINDR